VRLRSLISLFVPNVSRPQKGRIYAQHRIFVASHTCVRIIVRNIVINTHTSDNQGGVAQMVERLIRIQEAQGSIPCSSMGFFSSRLQRKTTYLFDNQIVSFSLSAYTAELHRVTPSFKHQRDAIKCASLPAQLAYISRATHCAP
jgi:hypothetical protein